ncbi:FAD-binding dehydrogenase [Catenuloplanes atrovinosus]|uniref:Oxidoreductase n=1 Tax=Catenuloplanes atrovinosus TaxID=137266 RepID=A0AAE4C9Q3_9ACTN|nr:FAD-binding dehydrogenase [Catenuloplanes atrovinosus]MDR7273825.1 putative oxidoreductase [Catenuloplanes atrovinosus]
MDVDVIVVGAGLAGLVAAVEAARAGRSVLVLDQEPEQNLGAQAHWSFGGLFLVDTPEQRRLGIRDSVELAWHDWLGTAAFDRDTDDWARRWAEAYVHFAAGEKRAWLRGLGHRVFPLVYWAERGGGDARGHGNTVPRFHITWGTGPGVVAPFAARAVASARFLFRHRVDQLVVESGAVVGVRGTILEPSDAPRGVATSRVAAGEFEHRAQAVIVASGGLGGDPALVRANWPARLGTPPEHLISGVPAHVDGRMLAITEAAGGRVVNADRMWHYTEGLRNWDPVWPDHGIRILPAPSPLWLDATGRRLPAPYFPGFDTLGTLTHLRATGYDHSWFILNQRIIEKEFALSGSEQNPDLTGRSVPGVVQRVRPGPPAPVAAFMRHGEDFVIAPTLPELVDGMRKLVPEVPLSLPAIQETVEARDREAANPFGKDAQLTAVRATRRYIVDRVQRVAAPHRLLDPKAGPLIAVRLNLLTRKTLGGLQTDLSARVLGPAGQPVPGLYAAGEVAGFGGGGMHGYASLEGTFLGGCLFTGRVAGREAAAAVA